MQYLKRSLIEEAPEIIAKIKIIAEDYPTAWDQLSEYYENPRLLLKSYY